MAETGMADGGSLEPVMLAMIATGAPMVSGPTVLQVLWLLAVGAAVLLGRRHLREPPPPTRGP